MLGRKRPFDISDTGVQVGQYVCPYCGVEMLPLSLQYSQEATNLEAQCPSCGYKLNLITDQTKHASRLTPKITEDMIADEDEDTIFETVDEDLGQVTDDDEEIDDFAEDDKRDEESLRREGYKIVSSN
jgi:DNA-directed RNA polymerase subunit RPC12/RpoP